MFQEPPKMKFLLSDMSIFGASGCDSGLVGAPYSPGGKCVVMQQFRLPDMSSPGTGM